MWDRAWIIDQWLDAALEASYAAGVEPSFLFVADPNDDTVSRVLERVPESRIVPVTENDQGGYKRSWNKTRYQRMVYLRNLLLAEVRNIRPPYFLSLDSDILIHRAAIVNMMSRIDLYDAVGSKAYLTPPELRPNRPQVTKYTTFAMLPNRDSTPKRFDASDFREVDILFAIKLMRETAYSVDYEFHGWGEDIGWSIACGDAGLRFGWDGTVVSKHVMTPKLLHEKDPRVGY